MVDADHLYAADFHWWKYHIADVIRDFDGKCWSCETSGKTNWGKHHNDTWGVTLLDVETGKLGLSSDPGCVHSGSNSGYQAINLAYNLGATRILLLGFDMHSHSGKSHWFGDHPKEYATGDKIERFISAYRTIKPEEYGIEIWNCSRKTALDAFPRYNLDDLIGLNGEINAKTITNKHG